MTTKEILNYFRKYLKKNKYIIIGIVPPKDTLGNYIRESIEVEEESRRFNSKIANFGVKPTNLEEG